MASDFCRKLYISNYRNIGIGKQTSLTINRSMKLGCVGGLIILVGPNNAGKSNVLDAINSIRVGFDLSRDRSSGSLIDPDVSLRTFDGEDEYQVRFLDNSSIEDCGHYHWDRIDRDKFEYCVKHIISNIIHESSELSAKALSYSHITEDNIIEAVLFIKRNIDLSWYASNLSDAEYEIFSKSVESLGVGKTVCDEEYESRFGTRMHPHVYKYVQVPISSHSLACSISDVTPFIKNVLEYSVRSEGFKKITKLYESKTMDKAELKKIQKKIDESLSSISGKFNLLYPQDLAKYSFNLMLGEDNIKFTLKMGEEILNLDWLSTGFRWYFDFYFNFLCDKKLEPGDIILMDEPALNLHVKGQMELNGLLRDFATRNELSIVMSTHSPFMINCDYLDEVRVVYRNELGSTVINDDFQVTENNHSDTLRNVLSALTIGRHVLRDPDAKLYFVEGVTDYNYLTAFRQLFERDDSRYGKLQFMPINGVGDKNDPESCFKRIAELREIEKNPCLLVDGDPGGDRMVEASKGKEIRVISLDKISPNFRGSIEKLFSMDDKKLFIPIKNSNLSSTFKHHIMDNKLTPTTKENFRKVLDYLLDYQS